MPHLVLSDVPSTVVRDVADAFVNAKAAARAAAVLRVLPREFYDGFVSALSKSRKPSPSLSPFRNFGPSLDTDT